MTKFRDMQEQRTFHAGREYERKILVKRIKELEKLLRADTRQWVEQNKRIKELEKIIEIYARHKPHCKMGEYNTLKTGIGCDCGLSEALKG